MKILFHRNQENNSFLNKYGIKNCYLKELSYSKRNTEISAKRHHHTDYEVHIVKRGTVIYEVEGNECIISDGQLIIIPPLLKHTAKQTCECIEKYALTFSASEDLIESMKTPLIAFADQRIFDAITFVKNEHTNKKPIFRALAESRVLEIIALIFRDIIREDYDSADEVVSDPRFEMAKRYIIDNSELALSVGDVASYCSVSEKQLCRLFVKYSSTTPLKYIATARAERVKQFISESDLTLSEISEKMNFNNEYYFNTFFKRQVGISPGAYKKMTK